MPIPIAGKVVSFQQGEIGIDNASGTGDIPVADKAKFWLFVLNPFMLASFVMLYVAMLTQDFLSFKYKVKGRLDKILRENWSDPFVRVAIVALASSLLLVLIGSLLYRAQLK